MSDSSTAESFIQLNKLRKAGENFDVTVCIDDKKFPCHRLVLSTFSAYFNVILNGGLGDGQNNNIALHDVDATIFGDILEAMYSFNLPISKNNVYGFLKVSMRLNIPSFENQCFAFIDENFPPNNVVAICILCHSSGKTELVNKIKKYVAENFVKFAELMEMDNLPLPVFTDILGEKTLERDEDVILKAIAASVCKNGYDAGVVGKLLDTVKLTKINSNVLANLMASAPSACFEEDDRAESEKSPCKKLKLEVTRPEMTSKLQVYVKGMRSKNGLMGTCALALNKMDGWEPVPADFIQSSLASLKTVIVGNRQYFLGCDKNIYTRGSCVFWYVENGKSVKLRDPPVNMSSFRMTVIEHTIYVYISAAGAQKTAITLSSLNFEKNDSTDNSVYAYNCDLDEWFAIPRAQVITFGSAVVTADRQLYILGGITENGSSLVAQRFDHRSPFWTKLPGLHNNQVNADACAYENKLYLSGSFHDNLFHKTASLYDIVAGKWEALKSMRTARSNHAFVRWQDALYALDNRPFSTNEKFVIKTQTWHEVPAIPKKISVDDEIIATYELNDALILI